MANSSRPPPNDAELLERSRAGDQQAFRTLVERHHGRQFATALGMLGAGPDAEEVVQETFVRFYRNLHRFEGRAALGTYLTRITMNEAAKLLRRRQRWRSRFFSSDAPGLQLPEESQPAAAQPLERRERIDRVRGAVQALKPHFREVVVLRYLNEYSTEECAQILGIPPGTVMSRLTRALDKMSAILKGVNEA